MAGEVKYKKPLPKGAQVEIIAAEKDCMVPSSRFLGHTPVSEAGKFSIEVFPPWGADVSLCAVVTPKPGQPARMYGKAPGPYHAEKLGEVVYFHIVIEVAEGPPHAFPSATPAPLAKP